MSTGRTQPMNAVSAELSQNRSRDRLVHVALSILRDGVEAEDAAHDAVVHALRGSSSFGAQSMVSTWLHRVVVNAALMRARQQRRISKRMVANDHLGDEDRPYLGAMGDSSPTAEGRLVDCEERHRLQAAVAELPPSYRDVVELCVFKELPL
ncbi:MAG TPA: sigma-70 family RNA polymerase sigma factor, partial [Polyangia bacterium]